jgi:hypothetical protein
VVCSSSWCASTNGLLDHLRREPSPLEPSPDYVAVTVKTSQGGSGHRFV